jgi:hypothetical protein
MYARIRWISISLIIFLSTTLIGQAQPSSTPRVWTITADTNSTNASQRTFTVKFSEAVTGVDRTDFATAGDVQFTSITDVTAIDNTADTYRVVVVLNGPSTQLALTLFDDDSIRNDAEIPLGGEGISNGNAVSDVISMNTAVQMLPQLDALQPRVDAPASVSNRVGVGSSMALTSNDIPVISYFDEANRDLKLAVCNDTNCTSPTISTLDSIGDVGYVTESSMALTSNDIPVISYYDQTNGNLKLAVCNDTNCTSPIISTLDSMVGAMTITLISNDIPIISYYDDTNGDLKLAICNNSVCTSPTISTLDSIGDVGWYSSITHTSNDIPVISYYDHTNGNLKLAVCNNPTCTSPTISTLDSIGDVGYFTSIALTSTDIPVISYHDVFYLDLKLAVCNNPACTSPTISTLDGATHSAYDLSMTLTSANIPIISYFDYNGYDLEIAICNNSACTSPTFSTVDSTGQVGQHVSLALTSTDIPVISYYDQTNGNLKLYHAPVIVDQGQPNSFNTLTPSANQRITTTTPTLIWQASTYATSYEYCYSTSPNTCNTWLSTGVSTNVMLTGLTHDTTYYWQVRAVNTSGTRTANGGTMHNFTVTLPPASFAKSAPANNATKQKTSVTLSWAASTRATSYEYCIALSTRACTTWKSTGTARQVTVRNLAKNKTYFWQVRAKNTGGTTLSNSTFWKFTTAP